MYPFIESIRIEDGVVCNLAYHNQRMNETRTANFGQVARLNLSDHIISPQGLGRIKCRVVYDQSIKEITYTSYTVHPVHTLQLVYSDTIDYNYKSTNREALNQLFSSRGQQDDILIVRNGLLTDTSIANIALFDGDKWHTPSVPLLKGTQRTYLLENNTIIQKEIPLEDLFTYQQMTLFNAMIPFGEVMITVDKSHIHL